MGMKSWLILKKDSSEVGAKQTGRILGEESQDPGKSQDPGIRRTRREQDARSLGKALENGNGPF